MSRVILILEDNPQRLTAMIAALDALQPKPEVQTATNVPAFLEIFCDFEGSVAIISLDHDLGASRDGIDPGTGRDVTRELSKCAPACHVVIHSTNLAGAEGMKGDLRDAGWIVSSVVPYCDLDWVREAWLPEIERCLRRLAAPE
jgi:hypothetical protein